MVDGAIVPLVVVVGCCWLCWVPSLLLTVSEDDDGGAFADPAVMLLADWRLLLMLLE